MKITTGKREISHKIHLCINTIISNVLFCKCEITTYVQLVQASSCKLRNGLQGTSLPPPTVL